MVKIDDVLEILEIIKNELRNDRKYNHTDFDQVKSELEIVDRIKKAICQLETRRRLIVINGGKDE